MVEVVEACAAAAVSVAAYTEARLRWHTRADRRRRTQDGDDPPPESR